MEQNYGILTQFKTNMATFKVMENTELLVRYRDNLMAIQQQLCSIGGTMGQMPPIPVQPDFELANKFLPPGSFKAQQVGPPAPGMPPTAATPVAAAGQGVTAAAPGASMTMAAASAAAPAVATAAPVTVVPGTSPLGPALVAPTPLMPMMSPFTFNPAAAAAGMGHTAGLPGVMSHLDSFFGAATGMPGAMGVMPPPMMPAALSPAAAAAAMGAGMPGAQFPFGMAAPGMLGCMSMGGPAPGMPTPTMPDAGAAAAAAAAAAAQHAALLPGVQMGAAPSMSRQGSAVQPVNVPITVKQETGAWLSWVKSNGRDGKFIE
jgi:hypothetical protein